MVALCAWVGAPSQRPAAGTALHAQGLAWEHKGRLLVLLVVGWQPLVGAVEAVVVLSCPPQRVVCMLQAAEVAGRMHLGAMACGGIMAIGCAHRRVHRADAQTRHSVGTCGAVLGLLR